MAEDPDRAEAQTSAWETLSQLAVNAARWIERHPHVIESFQIWRKVGRACEATRLYAPVSPDAWRLIADSVEAGATVDEMRTTILSAYGPDGPGYEALSNELRTASLLRGRRQELEEVLASFEEHRDYVTICGALPMVEGLLAEAYGKWQKRMSDYPIEARLDESGALTPEEEAELLISPSALEMVMEGIPEVWTSNPMRAGATTTDLNRHWVLHGTARGWNTAENATRSVLLVASAARVAQPLLAPRV